MKDLLHNIWVISKNGEEIYHKCRNGDQKPKISEDLRNSFFAGVQQFVEGLGSDFYHLIIGDAVIIGTSLQSTEDLYLIMKFLLPKTSKLKKIERFMQGTRQNIEKDLSIPNTPTDLTQYFQNYFAN